MLKRYLLIHALLVLFGISALYGQVNMTSMGLDCTDSLQKTAYVTSPMAVEEGIDYGISRKDCGQRNRQKWCS